jgi:hypothetical protein
MSGGLNMSGHNDNHPLYAAIDAKLKEVAAAPAPPPWHEAWAGLGPQSSLGLLARIIPSPKENRRVQQAIVKGKAR